MMSRVLALLVLALAALSCIEAFVSPSVRIHRAPSFLTACRVNAKREKIKRNRENMRKFKITGKRGTSRRKILKKAQSQQARQKETEFIAKCFTTTAAPGADQQ